MAALYRFFNAAADLLYVGISINPPQRWNQHRVEKPWWLEVAKITVETHESPAAAAAAERLAIQLESPRYNRTAGASRPGPEKRLTFVSFISASGRHCVATGVQTERGKRNMEWVRRFR